MTYRILKSDWYKLNVDCSSNQHAFMKKQRYNNNNNNFDQNSDASKLGLDGSISFAFLWADFFCHCAFPSWVTMENWILKTVINSSFQLHPASFIWEWDRKRAVTGIENWTVTTINSSSLYSSPGALDGMIFIAYLIHIIDIINQSIMISIVRRHNNRRQNENSETSNIGKSRQNN